MLVSIMSVSLSSVVSSVTRCWSKKQPKCFQNVALKQPMQLLHMSEVFRNSPKSCQSFGLLLLKNLLHRTFKNRSIWSHWLCHTALSLSFSLRPSGNCHAVNPDSNLCFVLTWGFYIFNILYMISFHCRNKSSFWAVAVAQLVELSLPIPEVRGSNPVISKNLFIQ